jgi:hypothetical protein
MRKTLVLAIAAASLGGIALAGSASAACSAANGDVCSGSTTVAFTVLPNVGTLSIVPAAAAAGSAAGQTPLTSSGVDSSKTVTVALGLTTVLDSRTASQGWVMSASASNFTQAVGGSATISKNLAKFSVPVAPQLPSTGLTGALSGAVLPTFTGYNASAAPTSDGAGNATLLTASATGVNAAVFTPVLTVDVTGATATTYTGTVTQSVS